MKGIQMVIDLGICTGCYACEGVCPHISFQQVKNVFLTPVVDKGCTSCGECLKFCPLMQQ